MDEAPRAGAGSKKDSSMRVAIDCQVGEADACVSGATPVRCGDRALRPEKPARHRPSRDRAVMPTISGHAWCWIGSQCRLQRRASAAVRHHGRDAGVGGGAQADPSVGLLNIGEEDIKGNEMVNARRTAARQHLNFSAMSKATHLQGTTDRGGVGRFVGKRDLKLRGSPRCSHHVRAEFSATG